LYKYTNNDNSIRKKRMKGFSFALSIFLVVGSSLAMPQYGQPAAATSPQTSSNPVGLNAPARAPGNKQQNLPDGCRIEYQNVQTIVEVESENIVCTPYTDRVCEAKYRQACNPYEDTECRTVYKKACEVKYKDVCNNLVREVPEDYVEDECKDELTRVCDSTWVIKANGDKVWEEDPTTCRQIPETKCRKVKKTRSRVEPYTTCESVEYEECEDVPEQECHKVTKEKCERQAYQDCRNVQKQNCETIHKKSPQNQTERRAVRICDDKVNDVVPFFGSDGASSSGQTDLDAAVIISSKADPRNGGDASAGNTNDEHADDVAFVFSN